MRFSDFLDDRIVFFTPRFVDAVVIIRASHRPIGRNHVDVELVNVVKLRCLRLGRAGHARQLLVKPEIILNRDRRQRLRLAIDLNTFLRFHRLMPPSLQRRPGILRPVNSSTMTTLLSSMTYWTSFSETQQKTQRPEEGLVFFFLS